MTSAAYDQDEEVRVRPASPQPPAAAPEREIPMNLEAEQALLGAILVNNRAYDGVAEFLKAEHFADPVNGRVYAACARAIERGEQASPITLKRSFDKDEALQDAGGAAYLVRLAASVVTVVNAADYGREIRDCFIRRSLVYLADQMAATASDTSWKTRLRGEDDEQEMDGDGLLAHAQKCLDNLTSDNTRSRQDYVPAADGVATAIARAEAVWRDGPEAAGTSTGITDLDRAIGGLADGRLYIDAGRPGMGKTALALRIARNVAKRDVPVGFLSQEVQSDELGARLLAMESGVTQARQEAGDLTDDDFTRMVAAQHAIESWPLYVDDKPAQSVADVRRRALRLRRKHGLRLLVVDYLQLLAPGNTRDRRNSNRTEDVSEITRGLKSLAMELQIPVLALSQLSRAVEQRDDKRPRLPDLRESGSIEQDADVVMFLYREEYYLTQEEPVQRATETAATFISRQHTYEERLEACRNTLEVIIAKRRGGPTGKVRLYANMGHGVMENAIRGMGL
jgi:replicative DNA helicase